MHVPGPYQDKAQQIYKDLRSNIIQNVFSVSYFAAFSVSFNVWIYKDLSLTFCVYRNTNVLDLFGNNTLPLTDKESAAIHLLVGPVPYCS
jgi:hypothetical protein